VYCSGIIYLPLLLPIDKPPRAALHQEHGNGESLRFCSSSLSISER
jgi:hypothetical protein